MLEASDQFALLIRYKTEMEIFNETPGEGAPQSLASILHLPFPISPSPSHTCNPCGKGVQQILMLRSKIKHLSGNDIQISIQGREWFFESPPLPKNGGFFSDPLAHPLDLFFFFGGGGGGSTPNIPHPHIYLPPPSLPSQKSHPGGSGAYDGRKRSVDIRPYFSLFSPPLPPLPPRWRNPRMVFFETALAAEKKRGGSTGRFFRTERGPEYRFFFFGCAKGSLASTKHLFPIHIKYPTLARPPEPIPTFCPPLLYPKPPCLTSSLPRGVLRAA